MPSSTASINTFWPHALLISRSSLPHCHVTNKVDAPLFPMYELEQFCHYHLVSQYPHHHSVNQSLVTHQGYGKGFHLQKCYSLTAFQLPISTPIVWHSKYKWHYLDFFSNLNRTRSPHLCFLFSDDQWMSLLGGTALSGDNWPLRAIAFTVLWCLSMMPFLLGLYAAP